MNKNRITSKLIENFAEAKHNIHIFGDLPDIITEEWFNENIVGKITYRDFVAFYDQATTQCQLDEYRVLRKDAYPPITDQLDMIYWDRVNGTNNWQTIIDEIKTRYPKP